MIKNILISCLIIFSFGCSYDPGFTGNDRVSNEEFTDPDYNIPRQISLEDISTSGDISALSVEEGIDATGDHYEHIYFSLDSENSGVIIDFNNFNPIKLLGSGETGGYGLGVIIDYSIPSNTYLDITIIPQEGDLVFQENIKVNVICYIDDSGCFHGNIIDFTNAEIGILKQRLRDNDFFGFKIEFILRPTGVVTEERLLSTSLPLEDWSLLFVDYAVQLHAFLNLLTGTDDIGTILTDNGTDNGIIEMVNRLYVVSTSNFGDASGDSNVRLTF